jgi:hypothetical protein
MKDIINFEGLYQISSKGSIEDIIRNKTHKIKT